MVYGEFDLPCPEDPSIFAYTRTLGDETMLIVLNWSDEGATFDSGEIDASCPEVVVSNYDDVADEVSGRRFRPYEATVYRL